MGKSTISMVNFNSCVKLPEGKWLYQQPRLRWYAWIQCASPGGSVAGRWTSRGPQPLWSCARCPKWPPGWQGLRGWPKTSESHGKIARKSHGTVMENMIHMGINFISMGILRCPGWYRLDKLILGYLKSWTTLAQVKAPVPSSLITNVTAVSWRGGWVSVSVLANNSDKRVVYWTF